MKKYNRFLRRFFSIFLSLLLLIPSAGSVFAEEASLEKQELLQRYMFTNRWMGINSPQDQFSSASQTTIPLANEVMADDFYRIYLDPYAIISGVYSKDDGTYDVYLSTLAQNGFGNGFGIMRNNPMEILGVEEPGVVPLSIIPTEKINPREMDPPVEEGNPFARDFIKLLEKASESELLQGYSPENKMGVCVVKVSDAFEIVGEPQIVGPILGADPTDPDPASSSIPSVERSQISDETNVLIWKMYVNLMPLPITGAGAEQMLIPLPRKNTLKITVKPRAGIYGQIAPVQMAAFKYNNVSVRGYWNPEIEEQSYSERVAEIYPVSYFYMPVVVLPEPSKVSLQTDFYADEALSQKVSDEEAIDFSRPLYVKYTFNGLSKGDVLKFKQDGSIGSLTFHDFEGDGEQLPGRLEANEEISIKSTVTGEGYFFGKIEDLSDFTKNYQNTGTLTALQQKYKDPGNPEDPEHLDRSDSWNMVTERYFTDQTFVEDSKTVTSAWFPYYAIINHVQEAPEFYTSIDDARILEEEKMTVTFDHNYPDSPPNLLRSVTNGSSLGILFPGNPVRPGYNFLGWYDHADGSGNAFTKTTAVTGNKTVYAKWEQIPVASPLTVTFDHNYPDSPPNLLRSVTSGSSLGVSFPEEPLRPGYDFLGWYDHADGSGNAFTRTTVVTENKTVYAKWEQLPVIPQEKPEVTVVFNHNYPNCLGDLLRSTPVNTALGSNFPEEPLRPGYDFLGWYDHTDGSGNAFTKTTAVTGNKTVYAKWSYRETPITHTGGKAKNEPVGTTYVEAEKPALTQNAPPPLKLNKEDHFAYVSGYPDQSFRPLRNVSRGEVASMFALISVKDAGLDTFGNTSFNDVLPHRWFYPHISFLEKFNILSGYPDGSFRPDQPITRAEFVAIASKFSQQQNISTPAFGDVGDQHWAYPLVSKALQSGWVSGYPDGSFKPDQYITRAEAVTVINKMLERRGDRNFIDTRQDLIKQYSDVTSSYWAYYDIHEASNAHDYEKQGMEEQWIHSSSKSR